MRPLGARTGAHFLVQAEAQDVEHFQVERIVDRHAQLAVFHAQRQDQVLAHDVVGDQVDGVGRDGALLQVDVFHVVLRGQRLVDVGLAAQLEIDQGFADAQVLGLGVLQGLGDLVGWR